jgi:hypothetical protein
MSAPFAAAAFTFAGQFQFADQAVTRVLVLAPALDATLLNDIDLIAHAPDAAEPHADAVTRVLPHLMLVDAAVIDHGLAALLETEPWRSVPTVLLVDEHSADLASPALAMPNVSFVSSESHIGAIRHELRWFDPAAVVADGSLWANDTFQRVRRDAERVAAALAELADARPAPQPIGAAAIRALIKARRARDGFFAPDLFADPAWDMLLDLTAARLENRHVSVSSLCIAAAVPTTTALRWIKRMCDDGTLARAVDTADKRRAYISLPDDTAATMLKCLNASTGAL